LAQILIFDAPETAGPEGGFLELGRSGHGLFGGRLRVGRKEETAGGRGDEAGLKEGKQLFHGRTALLWAIP
jgi:hypothetical protein